jgi:hypothetical protein
MKRVFAICLLAGVMVACSDKKDTGTAGKIVPRPATARADAGPQNAILEECEDNDDCTGAASCTGTCGLHELGDRACMCTADKLTCTACALNAGFKAQVTDATAFCNPGTRDGASCMLAGSTCINVLYNSMGVARREGCLCWMGRTQLQWDCTGNLNGFFQDLAPPSPPPPPPDGGVAPPVVTPPAEDASAAG